MMAGGLKESAATVNVEVARRIKDTKTYENTNRTAEVFNFELNDNLGLISTDGKKSDTVFTLEPFDEVYVRFSPGYQEQQVVNCIYVIYRSAYFDRIRLAKVKQGWNAQLVFRL